jgi:uncharacterized protein with von Willebrand factor type A (vWA) domain
MKLRDRARRLFGREERLSEHAVRATMVDHAVFHDVRKRATKIEELAASPPTLPNGSTLDAKVWERLGEDVWSEFFGDSEPALRAREKIDPRFRVNRELADKQARDDSFREARVMTRGHTTESALGWLGAMGCLAQSYGEELGEHGERENEIADKQDEIESLDDALAELRRSRQGQPEQMAAIDQQTRELAKGKRRAVAALSEAEADQQRHAGDLIDAARVAVAMASKDAVRAVKAASLLPGNGPGSETRVNTEQMIEFGERVRGSRVLQRVLEMMGRMELSMGTVRRTLRKGGYEEMVDIEAGNELALVLPHEKMLLMHPIGRLDFYRRFHEHSLMQYEMWSEQELKRGPVIFAADGSGSMQGAKNVFCRGLTLASCSIANHEGRNTAAIEFGSKGQLREFWFPGDRSLDTAVALDFAEHFFKGGTDINQVLARAYDLIAGEAPFHSADLVIVTDGGDRLTESTFALRDKLREMHVKIHGICVGIRPTQYMVETCDNVSSVFEFVGPNSTTDRLAIDLS